MMLNVLSTIFLLFISGISFAADTTITIRGNVKASPCTVDNVNAAVELGDYYISDSNETAWKNFALTLSACPAGTTSVKAKFSGSNANDLYENTGTAKGVDVELVKSDSGDNLGNGKDMTAQVGSNKTVSFPLKTRMKVTGRNSLSPGTVSAVVTVVYEYN